MRRITQFRFRGNSNEENYPTTLRQDDLTVGNLFRDYGPVSQFGIQAPPGLRFYLNNSAYPIMVGETGIYELDLENVGRITAIRFERSDLETFYARPDPADKLLIDIVYEGV